MVVFVLGVIVTVLVVVLLMLELELVGAVDNKAGHYSVSPGRQGWADGPREEATHVAVLVGGAPTPAPESIRANECRVCAAAPLHSGRSGLGMGTPPRGINLTRAFLLGAPHQQKCPFSMSSLLTDQDWQRGDIWA